MIRLIFILILVLGCGGNTDDNYKFFKGPVTFNLENPDRHCIITPGVGETAFVRCKEQTD